MGAIKTSELDNGNVGLEITYGGKESPFGGVDTSAPPAYIDPSCFTDCDGFIIVDGMLVAAALDTLVVPTLWNSTDQVILIGFGNFYNQTYGVLNYALGYKAVAVTGPPTGVQYTFYMTSWSPSNAGVVYNDTLVTTQFNSATPALAAAITMQLQTTTGGTPGSGAVLTISSLTSYGPYPTGGTQPNPWYLTGAIAQGGMTVTTPGIHYVVGTTYWVSQGDALTASIVVTSIDVNGGITGFTLNPSTFTTEYVDWSSNGAIRGIKSLSTAGRGYAAGTASLVQALSSNVVLEILGPSGNNTYTVASNGLANVVPSAVTASGAWIFVSSTTTGSAEYTQPGAIMMLSPIALTSDHNNRGTNYEPGVVLNLIEYQCTPQAWSGYGVYNSGYPDPPDLPGHLPAGSTLTTATGGQCVVSVVGAGGSLEQMNLINAGSGYHMQNVGDPLVYFIAFEIAAIPTDSSGAAYNLNTMAAEINGTADSPYNVANLDVVAAVNLGTSSLTLTAIRAGVEGNSIAVLDTSQITGSGQYYYYFPVRTLTYLTGGNDGTASGTVLSTTLPEQASIVAAGGILYIANVGPIILKYKQPGSFLLSSTVQGVKVLKKFAGSLIGLGLIPAPGVVTASTDMIFAWSASLDLDTWDSLDLNGNVTGAGFAQLTDIGDYLTGLIVTGGTAYILRSQGLSYATATGNATSPFNFTHTGLGDEGEGAQIMKFICQYDRTGVFVGSSDIFQLSNSMVSLGEKIKSRFFQELQAVTYGLLVAGVNATAVGGDINMLAVFQIDSRLFICNMSNHTWTTLAFPVYTSTSQSSTSSTMMTSLIGPIATINAASGKEVFNQNELVTAAQWYGTSGYQAPVFKMLTEQLANASSANTNTPFVEFPQEELLFGRDVTIDALYIALYASVTEDVTINFYISGAFFSTLVLTAAEFNSLEGVPIEKQVYPTSAGAFTAHSPQLKCEVETLLDLSVAKVRFVKLQMFGSMDQNQRPV